MTILVRPIRVEDAEGFHAALDSVARENRYLRLTEAPPIAATRQFIAANIERGNSQLVAIDDGEVVGWCDICRSDERGSEHCGFLGMGLISSHRGRGIGRQLITQTLAAAAPTFERVELDVYSGNLAAIALYEKVGFVHEGRRRRAIVRDGAYQDILIMALLFN
jgi:RimJ/RimL family protein N-acetyltransferase